MLSYNIATGKEYEGKNQAELMGQIQKMNFKSVKWGTFLQWRDQNRKIVKGQHGISIFKGFGTFDEANKDGKLKTESRPLGFARVFNEDQTEAI